MHNYEADRGAQELELANTAAAQNWILSLPIYPSLSPSSLSLFPFLAVPLCAVVDKTLQPARSLFEGAKYVASGADKSTTWQAA